MSMQPGGPALGAGLVGAAAVARETADEAAPDRDVERDADGEPVGRSDREEDVVRPRDEDPDDQHVNEEALDEFVRRERAEGDTSA